MINLGTDDHRPVITAQVVHHFRPRREREIVTGCNKRWAWVQHHVTGNMPDPNSPRERGLPACSFSSNVAGSAVG
jgi:hypothetical protein